MLQDIEIVRVTPETAAVLEQVAPDVFDGAIDRQNLAAYLRDALHLLVVAQADGKIVGQIGAMIHIQPDGPSQLYIDNLGVAPDYQRRGIARALLRQAFIWGQSHACGDAWVATEPDNLPARALYERLKSKPGETVAYYQLDIMALDQG